MENVIVFVIVYVLCGTATALYAPRWVTDESLDKTTRDLRVGFCFWGWPVIISVQILSWCANVAVWMLAFPGRTIRRMREAWRERPQIEER